MSTSIDERIVAMKFDNRNFEKNAAESIQTIDLLKSKLNFEDVQEELNNINTSKIKQEFSSLGDINTSKFETVLDKLEYRMSGLGIFTGRIVQNVADDIYKIVKLAGSGIDKIISFTKGGIIKGGYSRAANIQQAKHQLEGLNIAWKDISADIDFAVKDTAYSLDQAAKAASQLVTSGLMPGYQYKTLGGQERDIDTMAMVLRSASGVAAMSGGAADYATIADIFIKSISKGKFQGEEFNRISEWAGVNAKQTVADYYNEVKYNGKTNWTAEDVEKLGSKGEMDPMHVIEALYEKFGEHAVKANETLTGVMANTKSALARIGANFFEPIIANSGPLVTLFEVLRRSINDLNAAISPVVKLFANDVVQALEKLTNPFIEKEYERDENGEIKMDEKGNPMYTYKWKKVGGIFSDWLEPWHEATEVDSGIDRNHIPTMDAQQTYMEQYSSRAEKFASNMRTIFTSTGKIMYNFFSNNSKAFKQVFPEYKGMADLIVKVTTKIADKLEWISNLDFWNPPVTWKDSGWYAIIRGIFSGIDIIYRFGKALVEHFIKPIFSAGKTAASSLGIMDWIVKLSNAVYEFDQRLKNGEDVFGHFFEFIKNKLTQLKNFLGDLFTGKLNISEKLSSLKETLSTNISIPGWDSIANVFRKIGDAIGYAFDKLKEFFGFGKKEDQLAFTTGAGGYATGGALGLLNPILPNAGAVAGIIEKFGNKDDTKDLPTIGERISGFFGKIKEAFSNFDFSGVSGVLTTFNIGLIAFVGVLGVTLYKLFKLIDAIVYEMPRLAARFISAFELLVDGLTQSLRAYRVEKYTQSLINVAIAIGIIVGAFVVLFSAIALINVLDKENGTNSIETAGKYLLGISILLGGFIAIIMGLASKLSSSFSIGNLKDLSSINVSTMQGTMFGIAAILKAFIFGVIALSALVVIMGVLPENIIEDGAKRLGIIAGAFAGIILVIVVITELLSAAKLKGALEAGKKLKTLNYASGIMGLASVMIAFTVGILILTSQLLLLGVIPEKVWNAGIQRLGTIALGFFIFITAMEVITALVNTGLGGFSGKQMAATMLSMAALITSFAINALTIVAALKILDFVDNPMENAATLGVIFFVMGMAATIMAAASKDIKFTNFLGVAVMFTLLSGALIIIANALQKVGEVDNLAGSAIALGIIFGEIALALGILTKIDTTGNMTNVMLSMVGIMIGLLAVVGAIALAGKINSSELLQGSLVVGVALLAISAIAFGINAILNNNKFKDYDFTNIVKFAGSIALLSLALAPAAIAIGALMFVMRSTEISWQEALAIGGTLAMVIIGLGAVAYALTNFTKVSGGAGKHILASLGTLLTVCVMLVPIVAAIGMLFAAYKLSGISLTEAVLLMAVLAGGVTAIAFGAAKIVNGVAGLGKATDFGMKQTARSILTMMGSIALLMVSLGVTVAIISATGADMYDIMGIVTAISALGVVVGLLMYFVQNYVANSQQGTWGEKRMTKMIEMLVASVGSLVILGMTVGILSILDQGSLWSSVGVIGALAVVIGVLMLVLQNLVANSQHGTWGEKRMNKTIEMLVASVASLAILGITAGILSTLDPTKLWESVGIIAVLGTIMAGLTGLLTLLAKFLGDISITSMLFPVITLATVTLSIIALAFAMRRINDLNVETMVQQLAIFTIGLIAAVAIIGIAAGLLDGVNPKIFLTILSIAAALVAAGVMFFLVGEGLKAGAEALDMFVNTLGDKEKQKKVKDAFTTFGEAFAGGLLGFIHTIREMLPQWHEDLLAIIDYGVKAIVEALKILVADVALLFKDGEFIENLKTIFKGLADVLIDVILGTMWYIGKRLVDEVIAPLGKQLGEGLWEIFNGADFGEKVEETLRENQYQITQALIRNAEQWGIYDQGLAREIMKSDKAQEAIEKYVDQIWINGGKPTAEQQAQFMSEIEKIAKEYADGYNKAFKKAFVGEDKENDLGVQNGEYYQARTSRNQAIEDADAQLKREIQALYDDIPQWAYDAITEADLKIPNSQKVQIVKSLITALEGTEGLNTDEKGSLLLKGLALSNAPGFYDGFKEVIENESSPLAEYFKNQLVTAMKGDNGLDIKNGVSWLTKKEISDPLEEGIYYRFLHPDQTKLGEAVKSFADAVVKKLKSPYGFKINSPSKVVIPIGESITEGVTVGMLSEEDSITEAALSLTDALNTGLNPMYNAGKSDGQAYGEGIGEGIEDAIKNTGIKDKIFDNIKGKINIDNLKGKVGLDKGLKENVEGVKDIWNTLKNAVTNENGDFDLGFITEGIDLEKTLMSVLGIDDLTSQFGAAGVGNIDTSAFNMDLATQSLDMSSWKNEFEGFDVNDAISSNTLDLKIDLDTSAYDDFYKESATGNLIRGIPTQTYQRIPTNSSYVNNYTYNQNITSTQPLSTREVNRNTQLALTRNRWNVGGGGGLRR